MPENLPMLLAEIKAITDIMQSVNSAYLHVLRANLYVETQQYHNAISDYEKALSDDDVNNKMWIYRRIAFIYMIQKDYDTAIEYCNKAIAINSNEENLDMLIEVKTKQILFDRQKD